MIFSHPSPTGAVRAGEGENELAFGDASARARLQGREADAFETQHVPHDREALDFFFEERSKRLGGDVAPCKAGAAGRDDDINPGRFDPLADARSDLRRVVADKGSFAQHDARRGR
jgi:hypothetical protein